jgi:hypothetical protein
MTKLDELLSSIDPDRTVNQVTRRLDEAINSFLPGPARIQRYEEFETYLFRFCRFVEATILKLGGGPLSANADMDRGRFMSVLTRAYGDQGLKTAFEIARTGNEGGLYAVLRKLGEALAGRYAANEVAARVGAYWNGLSMAEKLAASDEYLKKYGHLLPSELTESGAGRIRTNLPKVLEEHARMMERLHRIGR